MKNKLTRYISIFLSGFLLMLSISFYQDYSFEEEILNALAIRIKSKCLQSNPQNLIVCAMNTASYLEERNSEVFGDSHFNNEHFNSLKVKLMSPSFATFNYGGGACGGYTLFLARLLKKLGFKEKIVQQNLNGVAAAHITLGVESQNKLLLLDPMFNYAFTDSSGKLSDINDVAKNWVSYYSKHVPPAYDKAYNYQSGWRFTNWDKLGFVSRSFYGTGVFIFGKSTMDNLSLRYWVLSSSKLFCMFSFLGFILICLFTFVPHLQKRIATFYVRPFKKIGLTVVYKNLQLKEANRKISR